MICVRSKFVQLFFVFSKSAGYFFKHHGNGGPAASSAMVGSTVSAPLVRVRVKVFENLDATLVVPVASVDTSQDSSFCCNFRIKDFASSQDVLLSKMS